jgi:hypothetical protein
VKTTRYFDEQVVRKRPYVTVELCRDALAAPLSSSLQPDGRVRVWGEVTLPGEPTARVLRVVLLEDGETVHNAFLDRGFRHEDAG